MHYTIRLLALTAVLAAFPAWSDMYKWVDERGVVHYSDKPPKNGGKLARIEDRLSIYQAPAERVARAAPTPGADPALAQRVESLERQLRAERQARQLAQNADDRAQAAYQRCLAERRVDCDELFGGNGPNGPYGGFAPYVPPRLAVAPPARRPLSARRLAPRLMPASVGVNVDGVTGVTAGNLVTFRSPAATPDRFLRR